MSECDDEEFNLELYFKSESTIRLSVVYAGKINPKIYLDEEAPEPGM